MIKLLLADDHKLVREGLKAMLTRSDSDIAVVGEAASGQEVLDRLEGAAAHVVLMDIDMPGMNGIVATRQVRERFPRVKVLMLTMADNAEWVRESLRAGAQGYVLKSAGGAELLRAIRAVADGEEYFSSDLTRMLMQQVQPVGGATPAAAPVTLSNGAATAAGQPATADLSPRELEVLQLIAKGHTNAQIAEILFNSRRTIETHRQNLLEKTGANNTATLILYAASHGLLE